jgi:ADP-ribosylglycohydrolase
MTLQDRYCGSLAGLAAGDALGTTLEFRSPGTFAPLDDLVGGGPFSLQPGQWTDDTSMALCLAESLVECQGMDLADQMQRHLLGHRQHHPAGPDAVPPDPGAAGRLDGRACGRERIAHAPGTGAPVLCPFFARDPEQAIAQAAESSRTTHGAQEAVDACRGLAALIGGVLEGGPMEELLSPGFCPVVGLWQLEPLAPKIAAVSDGSYKRQDPPRIRGTGYVVASLEAAL